MKSIRCPQISLIGLALLIAGYVGSDLILWPIREETAYVLTTDRVCVRRTQIAAEPRFIWMSHGLLHDVAKWAYSPANAVRLWLYPNSK